MDYVTKEQIETPALVIELDALERNIRAMADFMRGKKAVLRPHYKTFKCPTIAHMQVDAGARGICCAKLGEAETLVEAGIGDVLIANQIVDPVKVNRLAGLARGGCKITVAVDTEENIRELSRAAHKYGSTIHVLVEVDVGMGRCGINTPEEALVLARLIADSKVLVFEGIQAYEGHIIHNRDVEVRRRGVREMIEKVGGIKRHLEKNGLPVKEISGGGTGTYNITGDNTIWTEIQAGSYVFMDTVYNEVGLAFENALFVLATVIHKRPGVAVTDAGQKVCTLDQGLPRVRGREHLTVKLHEEHGLVADEKDELKYLEKIEYIPSHCCTTVNLHDRYCCVRNGLLEGMWPVTGRGKSR
jgi:D-serine deaminase-like pyridoxal phosphate-dependent protein